MPYSPTFKQLKYLCTLAKHRHFGKAAEACFVSQSTLSAAIMELEQNLGVILVERNNKGAQLTAIGRSITEMSGRILTSVDDLVTLAGASHPAFTTEMRLGVIPTIAPFVLPKILNLMRKDHPDFKLFIREELSEHLIQELYAGELDVLLLALPYPAKNVLTQHLFYDNFVLAYQQDHKVKSIKQLRTSHLQDQDLLLLEDGHCLRTHAVDACKLKSDKLNIPYQATSLNTLVQMVANNIGITLLPQMAVDANIHNGTDIATKNFHENDVWRSIGLMWRSKSPRQSEFLEFGELIKRYFDVQ